MAFNSFEFLVFFAVVFTLYWAAPWRRLKIILLLAASYWFYMSWNAKLAAVVAGSSLIDYFLARALERSESDGRRKAFLVTSIVMNLGLLVYFKYTKFFLSSFVDLLQRTGFHAHMPELSIILPIGISFYTFEALSYMIDLYMRRIQAEKNPIHFLLFISFFPRMIAGPIIRARNFLPQVPRDMRFDGARFDLGLQYVLMGLFKKIAIADRMACLADPVYSAPSNYSTGAVWIAVIAYSLEIYSDFSGYSDIAIGTAHMLGFKLPQNFDMPYLSRNISEFWRRWHISLSTWLRDYVFISLGGSRGTAAMTVFTLMTTMALCGLWHGANWTFVAWGVLQGVMMLIHRVFRFFCKTRPAWQAALETAWGAAARVLITFLAATLAWVIFRAQNFPTAGAVLHALFFPQKGVMVRSPVGPWSLVVALTIVVLAHAAAEAGLWKKFSAAWSPPLRGTAYAVAAVAIFLMATNTAKPFIYFQF